MQVVLTRHAEELERIENVSGDVTTGPTQRFAQQPLTREKGFVLASWHVQRGRSPRVLLRSATKQDGDFNASYQVQN
jgi:hypothetical protein